MEFCTLRRRLSLSKGAEFHNGRMAYKPFRVINYLSNKLNHSYTPRLKHNHRRGREIHHQFRGGLVQMERNGVLVVVEQEEAIAAIGKVDGDGLDILRDGKGKRQLIEP